MTAQPRHQSRRVFIAELAAMMWVFAGAAQAKAYGGRVAAEVDSWADEIQTVSADLRAQRLTASQWRDALSSLFARIPERELLAAIDFEVLKKRAGFAEKGVAATSVRLPGLAADDMAFYPKLFAVNAGRAIIPHGHANMVSAHLVLDGGFHLRQYDKLAHEGDTLILRPSIDRSEGAGGLSAISEQDDNVHWLIAERPSWTLDMIVTNVDEGATKAFDIFNLDMDEAEMAGDGLMIAPILGVDEALQKYG